MTAKDNYNMCIREVQLFKKHITTVREFITNDSAKYIGNLVSNTSINEIKEYINSLDKRYNIPKHYVRKQSDLLDIESYIESFKYLYECDNSNGLFTWMEFSYLHEIKKSLREVLEVLSGIVDRGYAV